MIKMDASLASATDVCPVCKSTAQTSPNLRFKVSSRCYHRICEGCVDRKFSAGKAQCPISGCQYNLWKRDWRLQTYEDLQVERDVDIRRRVWGALDLVNLGLEEDPVLGWEAAFVDLRAYNDYLEMKEEFAMNIMTNIDKAATDKKIRDYEIANGLRKEKDDSKMQPKSAPAKSGDYPDASGLIKGLKVKYVPPPRSPYNAFQDIHRNREYYDTLEYIHDRSTTMEQEDRAYAGYSFESYVDESLLSAFSGLGVLVGSEKGRNERQSMIMNENGTVVGTLINLELNSLMSTGTVTAGSAGFRNLRAMFENKSNDQSTSPPSRGRSPNGSVSSQASRQVSKVRTSFVAVERPGEPSQSPQRSFRKISDVSSMAELREEAIMEGNDSITTESASHEAPTSATHRTSLGAILKGSPFEAHPSTPVEQPHDSTFALPQPATTSSPEKPSTNGTGAESGGTYSGDKMQSVEQPTTQEEPTIDTKPTKPTPSALNTKTAASRYKESPTSAKKSPLAQKKDSPLTMNDTGPTFKPRGGVNKILGVIESSNRAKEERAKAEQSNPPETTAGPTIKPKGGANKITGIIESSNRAKEERAKAEQSNSQSASHGPTIKPKGGANKITGIIQSSKRAKEERAKADQSTQPDVPEEKKTANKEIKPPSVASKPTAASRAHAQKPEKQDKSSLTEQIRSPTTTRAAKLPSAATAGTAASAARKGAHSTDEEQKPTSSERRSILPQVPRVADISTRSSLAKKSSRTSLANGEDRPRSRVSAAPKATDESFLARMTRPTASSARRAQEKTQVGSPPRTRQTSANHEVTKKPGRKSLSTNSKPAPIADEANETLLEPVNEDTGAIMIEPIEQDEGEPGPAEEEEEVVVRQSQPAEVGQTSL